MKLPFQNGAGGQKPAPSATATPDQVEVEPQAPAGAEQPTEPTTEEQLFAATDRLVLQMIKDLEAPAPGHQSEAAITPKDRRESLRLIIEWLVKSKRFREDEDDNGGLPNGVEAMVRTMRGEIGGTKRRPAEAKRRTPARPAHDPEEGAALARALKR